MLEDEVGTKNDGGGHDGPRIPTVEASAPEN